MAVAVITHVALRDDTAAQEWDAAMRERLDAARLGGLQVRQSQTSWHEAVEQQRNG